MRVYQYDENKTTADTNPSNVPRLDLHSLLLIYLGADIDGEAGDDFSGRSVSLSSDGTIVAIGAYGNDENGSTSGHVRIFETDNAQLVLSLQPLTWSLLILPPLLSFSSTPISTGNSIR